MSTNSLTLDFLHRGNNLTYSDYIEQIAAEADLAKQEKKNSNPLIDTQFTAPVMKAVFAPNGADIVRKLQVVGTVIKYAPELLESEEAGKAKDKTVALLRSAKEEGSAMCNTWVAEICTRVEKRPSLADIVTKLNA